MPSLIPGYEYDIFISYRQKDNKGDKWVSGFIDALKTELEATFKEDISIYFDENPHDRLQETHNVDKSLEGKLKCLIFIPILSQTYCDPNSYAWQYEFLAFNRLAKDDRFGRDIRLRNGNFASRILPIRIHDLEQEDINLFEKETGSVLRAMDFVFRTAAGVNRPLLPGDNKNDNLNKTLYRDQINKVAHAIKEIFLGMKVDQAVPEEVKSQSIESKGEIKIEDEIKEPISATILNQKSKNRLLLLMSVFLCVIGAFVIFKIVNNRPDLEKSIAVLPFINDSSSDSTTYFINGLMEEITINLQKIKTLRVLGRTSAEQFRNNTTKSIPEIARELGVNYIVEGSGQKSGNNFRLRVQLIRAKGKEAHLWAESYEEKIQNTNDIFRVQSQIAQVIANELKAIVTPEEKQLIEKISTTNLDALYYYQKGVEELSKLILLRTNRLNPQARINNKEALVNARRMFTKALENDSTFAQAYVGRAREYWFSYGTYLDSVLILCNKALSYDNQVADAYILRGNYYWGKGDNNKAKDEYDKAAKINPNSWEAYYRQGYLYEYVDLLLAIDNFQKAALLNRGSELADIKYQLSRDYRYAGFYEKSKEIALEVLKLDGDSVRYLSHVSTAEQYLGNLQKALELRVRAYTIDSTNLSILRQLGEIYRDMGKWEKSLKFWKKSFESGQMYLNDLFYLGYAYLKNGYKEEADDCFNRLEKYCKNNIKLYPQPSVSYYLLASVYAIKGDKENTYEFLNRYNQMQVVTCNTIEFINYTWFDNIRNESEFQMIVREMEAKFQAQHERIRKWLEENNML
jgi:TolB-like protein